MVTERPALTTGLTKCALKYFDSLSENDEVALIFNLKSEFEIIYTTGETLGTAGGNTANSFSRLKQ